MLVVISPAKTLDYDSPLPVKDFSEPAMLAKSRKLIRELKKLEPKDVSSLMGISDKLGSLNYERFQEWSTPFTADNARPAALAFKGDVYTGLDAYTMGKRDFNFAQKHLRILSGLYGVLKPLDLMQPYRLEMGTRFGVDGKDNLVDYWKTTVTRALQSELDSLPGKTLVNLASKEYFSAVDHAKLDADIITPVFRDLKNGRYKIISFFAKKARGQMARWIIDQRLKRPGQLKDFDVAGYRYSEAESDKGQWVFLRDQPE